MTPQVLSYQGANYFAYAISSDLPTQEKVFPSTINTDVNIIIDIVS